LNASGVHFALTARPQDGASDSIRVATEALGDDNSLDLTLLVRGEVPDNASGRLLLASAPVSTSDSYFKTGSVTQGLTVYVPNLEIVSTDTEKKWQLAYRAVARPADPPVEKPAEPPVEKPAETTEIETPQDGGASPGDAPAPDGDPGPATNPGATDTPQTGGNDDATVDPAPGVNPGPATNPGITDTPQAGDSSGS
ncbi:autotransporter outer membrane beta-barrel domain-containing protein, partial [Achromobacter ruhlandii]